MFVTMLILNTYTELTPTSNIAPNFSMYSKPTVYFDYQFSNLAI